MRIAVIGHFGGSKQFNDGQTIKTVMTCESLLQHGVERIDRIDTYFVRKNPFRFVWQLLVGMIHDRKFIVMLSCNGRKVLFPLLYLMSRYLKKDIYHYAIGGKLSIEVQENAKWKKYISVFKGNWMESKLLVAELQKCGIKNAKYLPNFKRLTKLKAEEFPDDYSEPYRLCIFSRIAEEKGIDDAISAVQEINADADRQIVTLDVYGAVEPDYQTYFSQIQRTVDWRYCGVVAADQSVETLKDYFALLFPTRCPTEGIPGTIIDALSAGLPVIARRWQYCDEMLEDGCTGFVYDFDHPEQLKSKILYAIEHKDEMIAMKRNCLQRATAYSEEAVIQQILKEMGVE